MKTDQRSATMVYVFHANTFTLTNIDAANYAQTCPRTEASVLAKTFSALERYLNDPAAIRRARAYREAFEARANEQQEESTK